MKQIYNLFFFLFFSFSLAAQSALINEVNYIANDPDGHGIEVVAAAGEDLAGWSLVVYTAAGVLDMAIDLSDALIPDQENGYGTVWYDVVQNDGGGGAALIDPTGTVTQFISYGLAANMPGATYLGDSPTGIFTQVGNSVGLGNFNWIAAAISSPGSINTDQIFMALFAQAVADNPKGNSMTYPNPFDEQINVNLDAPTVQEASLTLYDLRGIVVQRTVVPVGSTSVRIHLNQRLPAGYYLLQFEDGANRWTQRLAH